jgi:hypothetical protein
VTLREYLNVAMKLVASRTNHRSRSVPEAYCDTQL